MAKAKDASGLSSHLSPALRAEHPHVADFLSSGGSYGVGRFGWKAYPLEDPVTKASYIVFSTPLTCEDMGEQVFETDHRQLTAFVPEAKTFGIQILGHTISASFEVDKKRASFVDKVKFRSEGRTPSFMFRLGDDYNIDSIMDSEGRRVPFTSAGGVVIVAGPSSAKEFTYGISYAGVVDRPQYAGSISSSEILLAQDYWYPTVGREAAPYNLTSYTPAGWDVIGQGELISQKTDGPETTSVFQMKLPVVYYSFSASKFAKAKDQIGSLWFKTYALGMDEGLHERNIMQSAVIDFYSKTFSPYPFSSWSTVITPSYGGGALEAYSYATYGAMGGEDAHEPSHTWWGGILPNSYLKSQWNESFAVFSEFFFQRERDLGNREERRKAFIEDPGNDPLFQMAPVEDGPAEIGPAAGSLGYGKGSLVLQMLEQEVGTETFLRCIHEWIRSHKAGELEEWSGFEAAVNRVTASDYKWFFDEWLRRKGWADFQVTDAHWADGQITCKVAFNGLAYRLKLEVLLQKEDGFRQVKDMIVNGTGNYSIPAAKKPALVSFDPWWRTLRTVNADEQPVSLRSILAQPQRYTDPAHKDWLPFFQNGEASALPSNLNGVLLVGSPSSLPVMADLVAKAGFVVNGNSLTYDGTTIDLNEGAAMAVVDLPGGGHCAIALGKTQFAPNFGRARLCLVDKYGRFLRGVTDPKTSGTMTFKM
ncbi:MAG TPA: M1 family aminopeptidase [Fimbriimonadaceae bacterium]